MKAKMINTAHIEGRIYESKLEHRVSKRTGIPYIGGTLSVATDDAGVNIIPVEFTYVAEKYNSGKENKNHAVLNQIITSGKTIMGNPGEDATMVRIDPAIGLNEWYSKNDKGEDALVSNKRLESGFIHIVQNVSQDEIARNRFECDMVIHSVIHVEENEDKGTAEKLLIKGGIFNFNKKYLPVEFSVVNPKGIEYFEREIDATPTEPVFTKVWGKLINETIVKKIKEENAFGEDYVKETTSYKRDWVITGMAKDAYEFDDVSSITAAELKEALANRQIDLANLLQDQKKREADKLENSNAFNTPAPAAGSFNF